MTVARGFFIIGISAFVCALVGMLIGLTLGINAPGYYRTVFRGGNSPDFNPEQVGIGLGLTQGVIAGLVIGCVVVLAVSWHNSRRAIILPPEDTIQPLQRGAASEQISARPGV